MEYNNDIEIAINYFVKYMESNLSYIICAVVSFLFGLGTCLLFLKNKKGGGIKSLIRKVYNAFKEKNIENIVFFVAILLVMLSIVMQCFEKSSKVSNIIINIFGTLIVSWLATKKNSEEEFKRREQEGAKKSRRYLNSIKTITTNAIKIISESIEDKDLNFQKNQVIVLERAKDQIEHIKIGIETSLNDWEDMMSPEDINTAHKVGEAVDTVPSFDKDKFESEEPINQEEA